MPTPPLDDILTQFTVVKEQKDLIDWCTLYYRELTVLARYIQDDVPRTLPKWHPGKTSQKDPPKTTPPKTPKNTSKSTPPIKHTPRVFPCLQSKNPPKWPFLKRRRYKKAFFSLQPPGGAKNPLFWRFLTIFDPFLTVFCFPRRYGPPPGMQKPPKRGGEGGVVAKTSKNAKKQQKRG